LVVATGVTIEESPHLQLSGLAVGSCARVALHHSSGTLLRFDTQLPLFTHELTPLFSVVLSTGLLVVLTTGFGGGVKVVSTVDTFESPHLQLSGLAVGSCARTALHHESGTLLRFDIQLPLLMHELTLLFSVVLTTGLLVVVTGLSVVSTGTSLDLTTVVIGYQSEVMFLIHGAKLYVHKILLLIQKVVNVEIQMYLLLKQL
jgi:hypothetical protein